MVMMSPTPTSALVAGQQKIFKIESKKDWGEERENDVIYAIKLKKVNRLVTQEDKVAQGLLYETQKVRYIKGATLSHLVSYLCKSFVEDQGERHFLTVFLATYRTFASPDQVLDLIVKESEMLKNEISNGKSQLLCSTVRVLRTWVDRYFEQDFYDPPHHPRLNELERIARNFQINDPKKANEFLEFVKSRTASAHSRISVNNLSTNLHSHFADKPRFPHVNEEANNAEAVKIFLNGLTPQKVAEQLTLVDANLFLRVISHHCLTAVRSPKEKPASVKATIDQFNRVVYCVLALCLCPGLKSTQRAKIISRWVEVAQACRELKNFSSLRAIISGLQTHPIHRLKRIWQHVPQSHINLLKELGQINTKDSIQKVGTAKVNTEQSAIDRVRRDASERRQRDIHSGITHGTVPFLGSFLTDLTYLHTARPDYIEKNFINFEKRRKEFELLAQLQLWQVSCRSYRHFKSDTGFSYWFNSITLPTDDHAIKLSEDLEPLSSNPLSPVTPTKRSLSDVLHHHHNSGLPPSGNNPTSPINRAKSLGKDLYEKSCHQLEQTSPKQNGNATPVSRLEAERTVNVQIIKKDNLDENAPSIGKELKLNSNDRSPAFVRKAFNLFEIENENVNKFKIKQLLPGQKELEIPDNGNVYYAMNSSANEFNFVLVEEGAELFTSKIANRSKRGSSSKQKKSRKIPNPLSPVVSSSPMKMIYRHLGFTDFFWANNSSYSLSKASRHDLPKNHERKEEEPPEELSDNESMSSTSSSKSRSSLWRKLTGLEPEHGPVETYKSLNDFPNTPTKPTSPGHDQRSTWPRNQDFSSDVTQQKLHRRAAIRKHHSHPRDPTCGSTSNDVSSQESLHDSPTGSETSSRKSRLLSATETLVTYEEYQELQRQASTEVVHCENPELRRYASDPCILDSNGVFDTALKKHKPRLLPDETSEQGRRASETVTTAL